jgi:bifunctional non-homologous end joining protein LigD
LASRSADPVAFQAARLVSLRSQTGRRPGPLAGRDQVRRVSRRARKDGERVRLWARTTSDYSKAFTRIRDAVTALPVECAVLDGEAIVLRLDNTSDFEGLRSRQGQAAAILVADDVMEVDGQDMRPEALEERRKRLSKLLSRSNKAMRDGIQLSEVITGDGGAIFRHACSLGSKASSRSASARATSAAGRARG